MRGAPLLLLGALICRVLALEDRSHMIFKILLPRANLRGGYVVLLGYLLNALFALECFSGNAGFELGSEMSSLSFHMSDFGVICPSQTSQSFNKTLAPFCGTTSIRIRPFTPPFFRRGKSQALEITPC